ncbi:tyrosyl-tRNA synthetase, partial [Mortierella claussenii]
AEPEKRLAQHTLAKETTELVHGGKSKAQNRQRRQLAVTSYTNSHLSFEAVPKALLATRVLFGSSLDKIKGQELIDAFEYDPRMVPLVKSQVGEMNVDHIVLESGLCSSRSEAKKLVKSGGFYVNNIKVVDVTYRITDKDWIDGSVCVLRSGKSNYKLLRAIH